MLDSALKAVVKGRRHIVPMKSQSSRYLPYTAIGCLSERLGLVAVEEHVKDLATSDRLEQVNEARLGMGSHRDVHDQLFP